MNNTEKPPLGLTPKSIWSRNRQHDIIAAIARYVESDWQIPVEWVWELQDLNTQAVKEKQRTNDTTTTHK